MIVVRLYCYASSFEMHRSVRRIILVRHGESIGNINPKRFFEDMLHATIAKMSTPAKKPINAA